MSTEVIKPSVVLSLVFRKVEFVNFVISPKSKHPADKRINTFRTGSFKLFKRPLPGFLTILTL